MPQNGILALADNEDDEEKAKRRREKVQGKQTKSCC